MKKLLHIASGKVCERIFTQAFIAALDELGGLEIVENASDLTDIRCAAHIRNYPIVLTGWGATEVPVCLGDNYGKLKYICNITGSVRPFVPLKLIEDGVLVTNWGDTITNEVAEGTVTLLLATLKDMHEQISAVRNNGWRLDPDSHGGSLDGLPVGVYGMGAIGRRFVELIRPFNPVLYYFDPYADCLELDIEQIDSLTELFDRSWAVVIHASLTDDTRHTVTADLLARLPDHGVIINTARGEIVDQEALFAELEKGRLRTGLDVLDPDSLPEGHAARKWTNCILTAHRVAQGWPEGCAVTRGLSKMHEVCIDNLRRYWNCQALRFTVNARQYMLST